MGFLLKAAFWLAVVVLLLPTPDGREVVSHNGVPVDGTEAIGVARDLVADMSGFCTRNPEACDTGIAAAQAFGVKAQHGARLLYDYLDQFTGEDGAALPLSSNGPATAVQPSPAGFTSQIGTRSTRQDHVVQPQADALQVQNVQTIRIPVAHSGQGLAQPHVAGTARAPAAVQAGLRTSHWQADPVGGIGTAAWRQPLSRAELSQPARAVPAHDTIGRFIAQVQ